MLIFLPPLALVPVHGAIQLGSNFSRIFVSLKEVDVKLIIPFIFGTLLGSYFGANIVENISPSLGQIGVGLFILYSIFGKFPQLGKKFMFIGGVVSSTMSILFGASGPIVATFIRSLNFPPLKHVATHGAMMTFQHGLKCLAFIGEIRSTILEVLQTIREKKIKLTILACWFHKAYQVIINF